MSRQSISELLDLLSQVGTLLRGIDDNIREHRPPETLVPELAARYGENSHDWLAGVRRELAAASATIARQTDGMADRLVQSVARSLAAPVPDGFADLRGVSPILVSVVTAQEKNWTSVAVSRLPGTHRLRQLGEAVGVDGSLIVSQGVHRGGDGSLVLPIIVSLDALKRHAAAYTAACQADLDRWEAGRAAERRHLQQEADRRPVTAGELRAALAGKGER